MSSVLTESEGDNFSFEYDEDLAGAVAPEVLPEREYIATVIDAKRTESKSSGKPQIVIKYRIDPEQYPVDFPVEHAPDGVEVSYYSPDVGNNVHGRYNMKLIVQSHGLPLSSRVTAQDFVGKRVTLGVIQRTNDQGMKSLWPKGLPKAA